MSKISKNVIIENFLFYRINGYNFALYKNGGGFFCISDEAYEAARNISNAEIPQALKDLYEYSLKKNYSKNEELKKVQLSDKLEIGSLWLGIAHSCNLSCSYCFANKTNYLYTENPLMDYNTAKNAVDFLVANRGNNKQLNITFFGGEPFLNFDLILKVLDYTKSIESELDVKFSFNLTTNGTLLNKERYELIKDRINIMISLDGTKEIHDTNRKTKDGRPTWDTIMKNLNELKEHIPKFSVRVTICKEDIDMIQIYNTLKDMGFTYIFMTDMVPNSSNQKSVEDFNINKLKRNYKKLYKYLLDNYSAENGIYLRSFTNLIESIFYEAKNYFCCTTGISAYYVTPLGDLYPCGRMIDDSKKFMFGNVNTGDVDFSITSLLKTNHIFNKRKCSKCWAKYLCGSQCYGDIFESSGDIFEPNKNFCSMQKFKIKMAGYSIKQLKERGGVKI